MCIYIYIEREIYTCICICSARGGERWTAWTAGHVRSSFLRGHGTLRDFGGLHSARWGMPWCSVPRTPKVRDSRFKDNYWHGTWHPWQTPKDTMGRLAGGQGEREEKGIVGGEECRKEGGGRGQTQHEARQHTSRMRRPRWRQCRGRPWSWRHCFSKPPASAANAKPALVARSARGPVWREAGLTQAVVGVPS